MSSSDAPILRQFVRWGEEYVSRALNGKFSGIIPPGVYHGFVLKPAGGLRILVDHEEGWPRSVAVVERDGYSISVALDDPGVIQIPAPGTWFVCIEAFYSPSQQGYQRIVVREQVEPHHVVLGKVSLDEGVTDIAQGMIAADGRNETALQTQSGLEDRLAIVLARLDKVESTLEGGADKAGCPMRTTRRQEQSLASGSTVTVPTYSPGTGNLHIFLDGLLLVPGADYTEGKADDAGFCDVITVLFEVDKGAYWQFLLWPGQSGSDSPVLVSPDGSVHRLSFEVFEAEENPS